MAADYWMDCRLNVSVSGPDGFQQEFSVTKPFAIVGSGRACDICIPSKTLPDRCFVVCVAFGKLRGASIQSTADASKGKFRLIDAERGIKVGDFRIRVDVHVDDDEPQIPDDNEAILTWKLFGKKQFTKVSSRKPILFGRSTPSQLIVPDAAISTVHGCFLHCEGRLWIFDLGSRNGLRHNRTKLDIISLKNGDAFAAGSVVFRYVSNPSLHDQIAKLKEDVANRDSELSSLKMERSDSARKILELESEIKQWTESRVSHPIDVSRHDAATEAKEQAIERAQRDLDRRHAELTELIRQQLQNVSNQRNALQKKQADWHQLQREQIEELEEREFEIGAKSRLLDEQQKSIQQQIANLSQAQQTTRQELQAATREAVAERESAIAQRVAFEVRVRELADLEQKLQDQKLVLLRLEARLQKEQEAFFARRRRDVDSPVNVNEPDDDSRQFEQLRFEFDTPHDLIGSKEFHRILDQALENTKNAQD